MPALTTGWASTTLSDGSNHLLNSVCNHVLSSNRNRCLGGLLVSRTIPIFEYGRTPSPTDETNNEQNGCLHLSLTVRRP